jgi:hypothetical protein
VHNPGNAEHQLDNAYSDAMIRIMKIRKNITLSKQAIASGERAAKKRGASLSALVERHLLSLQNTVEESEHYCPQLKPIPRPGDARYEYLQKKHA